MFEQKFDFIHWRLMLTCFNENEFKALFLKIYDNLKPGGCRLSFYGNLLKSLKYLG